MKAYWQRIVDLLCLSMSDIQRFKPIRKIDRNIDQTISLSYLMTEIHEEFHSRSILDHLAIFFALKNTPDTHARHADKGKLKSKRENGSYPLRRWMWS